LLSSPIGEIDYAWIQQSKIGVSIMKRFLIGLVLVSGMGVWLLIARGSSLPPQAAPPFSVQYLEGTQDQKARAYSPAVITEGGRIIWLAGQSGGGAPGNFSAQAKSVFDQMQATLNRSGASLKNIVSMKVFLKSDPSNGDDLVKILHEVFPDGKYPASTVVTTAYAPSLIEIQAVAVVAN
jgi:enamine deaminase RidA (YjgF/YER057c/UK114 family)